MPKPSTSREYGYSHRVRRAKARRLVDSGNGYCWRCGKWLEPGKPFDLGHDDHDRTIYRGPECVNCNRTAGGRASGRARRANSNTRWFL